MGKARLGFGIIGCGTIAPFHVNGIMKNKDADLVAVSDVREDKTKEFAGKYGIDWYTDFHQLLRRNDIDIVSICTPSSMHADMTVAAAKAGKHVIVEKPLGINLEQTDRAIKACQKAGVKLAVAFQLRLEGTFKGVKRAIDEGVLGNLILGDTYIKSYRSQEYYDSADWKGTWEFDGGGALMNQGIHGIDLLLWMMGPVDTVYAYTGTLARNIQVEDTAVAVLTFKNGAFGVIEGTTSVYPGLEPRLEIHGTKGTVVMVGNNIERREIIGEEKEKPIYKESSVGRGVAEPTDIGMEGHRLLIEDMIEAMKENRSPAINGSEGRKAVELILAIYRSARTNKAVKLGT
ncbi:Gfo/Idh/MocA family oxidoreductase [candidate division KSB1 bacterium]|nr:Gfo/Idh/MocA family oxidoreductase [candidate division KSB1 bacterium]